MTEERIARLNELARKSKTIGLTEAEKQEQATLRLEYLAAIRQSLEAQLDNVYIVEADGTQTKLKKKDSPKPPKLMQPAVPAVLYRDGPAAPKMPSQRRNNHAQYVRQRAQSCPRRPRTPWWPNSMRRPPRC